MDEQQEPVVEPQVQPEAEPVVEPVVQAQPQQTDVDRWLDQRRRTGAGISLLMAVGGGILGGIAGGWWGAGSGVLIGGAARNTWRAKAHWNNPNRSDTMGNQYEAAKSLTMALVGFAAGGFLAYQAYKSKREE